MELLHYRLKEHGIEIHSEIVCRRHYDQHPEMFTLSKDDLRKGYTESVTPYSNGDRACESCDQSTESPMGASA